MASTTATADCKLELLPLPGSKSTVWCFFDSLLRRASFGEGLEKVTARLQQGLQEAAELHREHN